MAADCLTAMSNKRPTLDVFLSYGGSVCAGHPDGRARIAASLRGLCGTKHRLHAFRQCDKRILFSVHDRRLIRYLSQAESHLKREEVLKAEVVPSGVNPKRSIADWRLQASYFVQDSITPVTRSIYRVAARAASACVAASRLLLSSNTALCFAACRPPGHHATRTKSGGYCYLNNASIAAHYLSGHGRVAVLDIDYHHGNGTQDIFYDRRDVLCVSLHGPPDQAYPYCSGFADETGRGDGVGFNMNVVLPQVTDDSTYLRYLDGGICRVKEHRPRYLVVSLGFDIMRGDPAGRFVVSAEGLAGIASHIAELDLPTLVVLEGGYNDRNITNGTRSFFAGWWS